MAHDRLEFHQILKDLLPEPDQNVYFQPPATLTMEYPCIVYQRDYATTQFANNGPYSHTKRYQVSYISKKPDSDVYDKLAALPLSLFLRFFVSNNLNHDIFIVYF